MGKFYLLVPILISSLVRASDCPSESLSDIDHVEYAMRQSPVVAVLEDVKAQDLRGRLAVDSVIAPTVVGDTIRSELWKWPSSCPYPGCQFHGTLLSVDEHLAGIAHAKEQAEGLMCRFVRDPVPDFEIYCWQSYMPSASRDI